MGKIIAVIQHKGGTGKTTTVANLGAGLAILGKKTLIIDLDPQANLSLHFGNIAETDIMQCRDGKGDVKKLIKPTDIDRLTIIPSSLTLADAEIQLVNSISREYKLKQIVDPIKSEYDYILVDTGPNLGLLLWNALTACDSYLIPISADFFALAGMVQLNQIIDQMRVANPTMTSEGILMTRYDKRLKAHKETLSEVEKGYGDDLIPVIIPNNTALTQATWEGTSIFSYAPSSTGAKAYRDLAEYIVRRDRV